MRRASRLLFVFAIAAIYSTPTFALHNDVDRIFFNDCGRSRVVVGEIHTDCQGNTTSWGVVTDFEQRETTTGCDGPTRTTFWECGTQVSSLDICVC